MKQEQRLLIALVLIAGILSIWSVLTPPERLPAHRPPPQVETARKEAVLQPEQGDKTHDFTLGRFKVGIGLSRGGIGVLETDREVLLDQAVPGLLEIRCGEGVPEPVRFENRQEGDALISEGTDRSGTWRIRREIRTDPQGEFTLQCRIELSPLSAQSKAPPHLEIVTYRPLHLPNDPRLKHQVEGTFYLDGKVHGISIRRGQGKDFPKPSWVASQGRSYVAIVESPPEQGTFHVEHPSGGEPVAWLELPVPALALGQKKGWDFLVYAGPMALDPLREAGLEEALSFGAFSGVARELIKFLSWIYNRFHNYGLAIILLSLAVWLPFSPLTWYSRMVSLKTMRKMAEIKPQESRIRKEYKDKPEQMHKELMQLYKKHGVNPASGCIGCLPLLFTWPIYIALFQVLTRAPELRGASFLWIKDLSEPDGLVPLPAVLPLLGSRLNILPIAATVATYFQQAMMQPPQDPVSMTDEQKAQQQMMKFFPLIFMVVFYQLPSGFMLYWVVNSVLTVVQQILADRLSRSRASS